MTTPSSNTPSSRSGSWGAVQVGVAALVVLLLGIVLGYLFHNSPSTPPSAASSNTASSADQSLGAKSQESLDAALKPLLAQLQNSPNDPDLLNKIGNVYYDNHAYTEAVSYYQKYLALRPNDADVGTDMGTAIWYSGNPDGAIRQYETVLRNQPDYPNTLFNMGVVKWQGKHENRAALACWERLLKAHPDYPDRQKVEEMIRKVQDESVDKLMQKVQAQPNQ